MKVDRAEFAKNLPKKGFVEERDRDHVYFHHYYQGRRTAAYTYVSHTAKMREVSGDLLKSIRKQLHLDTTKEAVDLLTCPMTGERYVEKLKLRGVIEASQSKRNRS